MATNGSQWPAYYGSLLLTHYPQNVAELAVACPGLTVCGLGGNAGVSDTGIKALAAACPKMTHVYLDNTSVGDDGALALATGCGGLTEVHLVHTKVTDAGKKQLKDKFPELTIA